MSQGSRGGRRPRRIFADDDDQSQFQSQASSVANPRDVDALLGDGHADDIVNELFGDERDEVDPEEEDGEDLFGDNMEA